MRHLAFAPRPRADRSGFALILVLITLTLATVVAIFFLSTVARERSAVDLYSQQSRVRQLADLPVRIVEGQINAATREGTLKTPVSWASQPGMIRTYSTDGALSNAYKLYSWDRLVEYKDAFDPNKIGDVLPPKTWESEPAVFTDLNQPVNGVYPIADPNTANFGEKEPYSPKSNVDWDFAESFAINNSSTSIYAAAVGKAGSIPTSQSVPNTLPMPVKWIYVLQDGAWTAPTGSEGTPPIFGLVKPTAKNPIVGRIAFWTDDETSKVNINTAGEGAYWDWPKSATKDEMQLASNPPVKGEFQRISGHPSTTSLSAVLPELRPITTSYTRWLGGTNPTVPNTSYVASMGGIFDLTPRVGGGVGAAKKGSNAGTFPINYNQTYPLGAYASFRFNDGSMFKTSDKYSPLTINPNRLYVTPDDFWYKPFDVASSTDFRPYNNAFVALYNSTGVSQPDPTKLRQRSFFLTANSRAPETTLLETPRVSLWPITWPYPASYYFNSAAFAASNKSYTNDYKISSRGEIPTSLRYSEVSPGPDGTGDTLQKLIEYENPNGTKNITPQEQLLAFDATLNKGITELDATKSPSIYYFQRQSPDIPTHDWANIKRNRQLVNYLRGELDTKIPGAGLSLASKWDGANLGTTDWITLNAMDYSRSMINQYTFDPEPATALEAGALQYSYTGFSALLFKYHRQKGVALTTGVTSNTEPNAFAVAPLRVTPSMLATGDTPNLQASKTIVTNGAYPTLKEVAVMFYASKRNKPEWVRRSHFKPPAGMSQTDADALTAPNKLNPYQYLNLICLPRNKIPTGQLISPFVLIDSSNAAGKQPDGTYKRDESTSTYPCNLQTTSMRAVMLFYFTGLRSLSSYDNSGISYNPTFWIKVEGTSFKVNQSAIGLPKAGSRAVQFKLQGGSDNPMIGSLFKPGTLPKRFENDKSTADYWALVSDEIGVNGDLEDPQYAFSFAGTPLTISLYAPLPFDPNAQTNPDMNPTMSGGSLDSVSKTVSDRQLVAQYKVDFTSWSTPAQPFTGGMPIPTAPRYNVRQPTDLGQAVTIPGDPDQCPVPTYFYPKKGEPGAPVSLANQNWLRSEMVPDIQGPGAFNELAPASTTTARVLTYFPPTGYPPAPAVSNTPIEWGKTVMPKRRALNGWVFKDDDVAGPNSGNSTTQRWAVYVYEALASKGTAAGIRQYGDKDYYDPQNPMGKFGTNLTGYPTLAAFSTKMENRVASQYYMFDAEVSKVNLFSSGLLGSGSGSLGDVQYRWTCPSFITPYDTVISMIVNPEHPTSADPRLGLPGEGTVALSLETGMFIRSADAFTKVPLNNGALSTGTESQVPSPVIAFGIAPRFTVSAQYHQLGGPAGVGMDTGFQLQPKFLNGGTYSLLGQQGAGFGWATYAAIWGNSVGVETTPLMVLDSTWDWTTQAGSNADGAYIQRADQDYQSIGISQDGTQPVLTPYFSKSGLLATTTQAGANANAGTTSNFFSPNRQVPSPIVLGTIPASLSKGFQTLCFSPNPAAASAHLGIAKTVTPSSKGSPYDSGASSLPDHFLLDLFWMPVAEPYPISEQFSTAGKINLNYAMMPFPYIKRKTGMNALLKSVWIYAMPSNVSVTHSNGSSSPISFDYKTVGALAPDSNRSRYPIHIPNTLRAFDYKFEQGDIFRSASQICEMFLYPANPTNPRNTPPVAQDNPPDATAIKNWWNNQKLTSDNGREEPYNAIYSRVTTKSNTYTVHWRVQSLRKTKNSKMETWEEGKDQVLADLRGSTLIERYLDPNATDIPDYAALAVARDNYPPDGTKGPQPLSYYYKWRVATANYFQP